MTTSEGRETNADGPTDDGSAGRAGRSPLAGFFPRPSPPESLHRRIARTYLGMLLGPLLGFGVGVAVAAVIASSATTWAALGVIVVVGLICLLGGWGLGLWHTHRLALGSFTVSCAAFAPLLVLVVAATWESWLVVTVLALTLPMVVALLAHRRWWAGAFAATAVVSTLLAAFLGWLPAGDRPAEDRLVDDLQASGVEAFAPPSASGLTPTDVQLEDTTLTYEVVDGGLTHSIEVTRRPAGDEPIAGLDQGRTPAGDGIRYVEGMLITVESRGPTGDKDPGAARELAQRLQWQSPRSFARGADL